MVDGLPGHAHEFYRLIKDAPWLGGDQEYSCRECVELPSRNTKDYL